MKLALCFDWIPEGTLPPSTTLTDTWNCCYLELSGQCVTPEDADKLADALEKALEAIPDIQMNEEPVKRRRTPGKKNHLGNSEHIRL